MRQEPHQQIEVSGRGPAGVTVAPLNLADSRHGPRRRCHEGVVAAGVQDEEHEVACAGRWVGSSHPVELTRSLQLLDTVEPDLGLLVLVSEFEGLTGHLPGSRPCG